MLPFRAAKGEEGNDWQPGLFEQTLLHVLIHADGGAKHSRADVRQARKFEQALHGAIFAERAVQNGEHDVHCDA